MDFTSSHIRGAVETISKALVIASRSIAIGLIYQGKGSHPGIALDLKKFRDQEQANV